MNIVSMMNPMPTERPSARDAARDVAPRSAARADVPARARSSRRASDAEPREDESASDERTPVSKQQFSSLLALLAGAGEQVRTDLVKQLPEETASLVDKLLEDSAPADASAAADPQTKGQSAEHASARGISAREAGEALHYGLLKLMPADSNGDAIDLAAVANASTTDTPADTRPLNGLARAASRVSEQASDRSRALEAIARVAGSKGTSVEQLLAMGDTRGAAAKQSLEALLDAAGTPAGARLAARQLLSASRRSVLGGDDATLEAMASLEALKAKGATSGDVTMASKDLTGLSTELQAKVQRVTDRMKSEFGHDVTIVETTRSQDRQDWLFEQGRSRAGQVVTWTRDSAHTRGEAVDVMIDGSYDNPQGFARLQQIAKEEGLRTLGARDPGHLELPKNGAEPTGAEQTNTLVASAQRQARERAEVDGTSNNGARGVARVAGVANVAGVAQSARDARDASSLASNGIGSTVSAYASAQNNGRDRSDMDSNDTSPRGRDGEKRGLALGHSKTRAESGTESLPFGATGNTMGQARGHDVAVNAPAHVTGSSQAERVSDIQQMRADAPATPISRMTLNVDGADGTSERITVDVRGSSVNAHITTDAETADRLRLRTADLQDALGRHGLDGDSVRVSASTRTQDGRESARTLTAEREGLKIAANASASQDGANANGQQGRAPREWDRQDETRREQAARTRDERQQRSRQDAEEQQERQRRQTLFTGNA
jgi:peptidoglycan L-alanyl-D-glutamate endopeptidase CwlK